MAGPRIHEDTSAERKEVTGEESENGGAHVAGDSGRPGSKNGTGRTRKESKSRIKSSKGERTVNANEFDADACELNETASTCGSNESETPTKIRKTTLSAEPTEGRLKNKSLVSSMKKRGNQARASSRTVSSGKTAAKGRLTSVCLSESDSTKKKTLQNSEFFLPSSSSVISGEINQRVPDGTVEEGNGLPYKPVRPFSSGKRSQEHLKELASVNNKPDSPYSSCSVKGDSPKFKAKTKPLVPSSRSPSLARKNTKPQSAKRSWQQEITPVNNFPSSNRGREPNKMLMRRLFDSSSSSGRGVSQDRLTKRSKGKKAKTQPELEEASTSRMAKREECKTRIRKRLGEVGTSSSRSSILGKYKNRSEVANTKGGSNKSRLAQSTSIPWGKKATNSAELDGQRRTRKKAPSWSSTRSEDSRETSGSRAWKNRKFDSTISLYDSSMSSSPRENVSTRGSKASEIKSQSSGTYKRPLFSPSSSVTNKSSESQSHRSARKRKSSERTTAAATSGKRCSKGAEQGNPKSSSQRKAKVTRLKSRRTVRESSSVTKAETGEAGKGNFLGGSAADPLHSGSEYTERKTGILGKKDQKNSKTSSRRDGRANNHRKGEDHKVHTHDLKEGVPENWGSKRSTVSGRTSPNVVTDTDISNCPTEKNRRKKPNKTNFANVKKFD